MRSHCTRGPFGPAILFAGVALLTAAFVVPASAQEPPDVVPGQKLQGELLPSEMLTLGVRGIQGAKLTLRLRAARATPGMRPTVLLEDPDGVAVDLAAFLRSSAKGNRVTVAGLPLAKTGTYFLTVADADGAAGAFELVTRAKTPSRAKGTLVVANPGDEASVPVVAHESDRVQLKIKLPRGSTLAPWIRAFVPASGAEMLLGHAKRSPRLTMETGGTHRFAVTGVDDSTGAFSYVLTVQRARAPRGKARARDYARPPRDLVDDPNVYDVPGTDIVPMYVTIRAADNLPADEDPDCDFIDTTDEFGTTLADLHADTDPDDACKPELNVVVAIDGIPDAAGAVNAEMRVRGQSTRRSNQKSYRIKLKSKAAGDLWRGQRVFNLNKHPYDLTRFRNKLSFDLFTAVPDFTSLSTQFVRLYIDQQDGNGFVDFGLYTQVEKVDDFFLASHGLDVSATTYKAEFFEFHRYPDHLRLPSDPDYDETLFQSILEVETGGEHAPLLAMLDAVNDEERDFGETFATFFNEDNYLTWLASQVLLGNDDTNSQNFFLYRPRAGATFYFLPWDYDGAWDFYGQPNEAQRGPRSRWRTGISNWWGSMVHRRFLKQPGAVARLTAKMDELRATALTEARIQARIDSYSTTVRTAVFEDPDRDRLPLLDQSSDAAALAEYDAEAARLPGLVARHYDEYLVALERPMPVFMAATQRASDVLFSWDESFDLQGDGLTYDFEASLTPRFEPENIVVQSLGLVDTTWLTVPLSQMPAGTYFYRVIVRDDRNPAEHWQVAFHTYWDQQADSLHYGVERVVIE